MKSILSSIICLLVMFSQFQNVNAQSTHTFTYHQISATDDSWVAGQDWQHVICGNGNRVVWFKQTNPKKVFVMNSDGSGMLELADLGTDRLSQVNISDDGTKVVYVGGPFAAGHQIHYINADGTGENMILALGGLHSKTLRITGDGNTVFFNAVQNTSIAGGGGALERGVYSMTTSGGGLTQVAGPAQVATSLGIAASDVGGFSAGSNGPTIDVSYDGTRVIFMAKDDLNGDHHVFTSNGTAVNHIYGPVQWIPGVGISSDGEKIAFTTNPTGGDRQGFTANYDGTGLQMIASNNDMFYFSDGNSLGDRVSLTENGSHVRCPWPSVQHRWKHCSAGFRQHRRISRSADDRWIGGKTKHDQRWVADPVLFLGACERSDPVVYS